MWEFLALSLFSGEVRLLAAVRNVSVTVGRTDVTLMLINIVCDSQRAITAQLRQTNVQQTEWPIVPLSPGVSI